MVQQKKTEVAIGVFVVAAMVAVAAMILTFGGGTNFLEDTFTTTIEFTHIGDLKEGAPVKLGGFPIGKISEISLQDDGRVKTVATIRKDSPLRMGTTAKLATSGLVGDTFVELTVGKGPGEFPKDGSMNILGGPHVTTDEILKQVSDIGVQVTSIVTNLNDIVGKKEFKDNILVAVDNTAKATDKVNKLLDDFTATSKNIQKASEDVVATIDKVKGMVDDMRTAVVSKENIQTIKDTIANVKTASDDVTKVTANMKNIMARADKLFEDEEEVLRKSMEDVAGITQDLRQKLAAISTEKGVLRYFTTDDLNKRVDSILASLDAPLKRVSNVLSTMSKVDLMKAYVQGSRMAKRREKELVREGKRTVGEMSDAEFEEEQRVIEERLGQLEKLGAD